jgi:hypothetical protein
MVQNKLASDDTASILDCVDGKLSKVESTDSDNEIS